MTGDTAERHRIRLFDVEGDGRGPRAPGWCTRSPTIRRRWPARHPVALVHVPRRRHADFPAPSAGTEASPAYDLDAVRAWLAARGQLPASSPADELRVALRAYQGDGTAPYRLLPLVLAADRLGEPELAALAELADDPRWVHGLPPKAEPELAWVQHCLARLAVGAPAVLLMPPAAAERAAGRRVRAELVRSGALRAVVALPAGAAAPLHVGLHLWLLERPRAQAGNPRDVLFVDTAEPDPPQPTATAPGARRPSPDRVTLHSTVVDAWRAFVRDPDGFEPVRGTARAVPAIDLLDEPVDPTPARHVRTAPTTTEPDRHAETARALRTRLRRAASGLAALSGGESWPPAGTERRSWRSATVADLLRGGALTLLRVAGTSRDGPVDRTPAGRPHDERVGVRPGDVILPEIVSSGPLITGSPTHARPDGCSAATCTRSGPTRSASTPGSSPAS